MSNLERGFVRLPPDSTGKKSSAAGRLVIEYQGEASPNLFEADQTVVGSVSSATALVVGKYTEGFAAGEGQLFLELESLTDTFVLGEDLQISAVTYATIKATAALDQLYYQKQAIVDKDTPNRSLRINSNGAADIQFPDGPPALSSFGGLITENTHSIRQYVYSYDDIAGEFWTESVGSGAVAYDGNSRSVTYDTNDTASGTYIRRTSHYYHPYQPGTMNKVIQSMVVGDNGKAGVRRRWGLFDANDGLFWELDDSTLYVVQRSTSLGSGVIDTKVAQADFNEDRLDGSTKFTLDLTKNNLYTIEYQWLGAGIVRFGVQEEGGARTSAHVFRNPNSLPTAFMQKGSLPLRFECENTATAASSSELTNGCSVVQSIGNIKRQAVTHSAQNTQMKTVTQASGEVPIMSFQPVTGVFGLENRVTTVISDITATNMGNGPAILRIRWGGILDGASFTGVAERSASEWDETASGISFGSNYGLLRWSDIVVGGQESLRHSFVRDKEVFQDSIGVVLLADGVTQAPITVTAEVVDPTHTGQILMTTNWKEMWV